MSFLSEGLAPEDDLMEEDFKVDESSSQTQVKENEPKTGISVRGRKPVSTDQNILTQHCYSFGYFL